MVPHLKQDTGVKMTENLTQIWKYKIKIGPKEYWKSVPITLILADEHIDIYSPYDSNILDMIRDLEDPRAEYVKLPNGTSRFNCWRIPYSEHNTLAFSRYQNHAKKGIESHEYDPDTLPEKIKSKIRPHQLEAINFIFDDVSRGALISHEMGLGKTLVGLAVIDYCQRQRLADRWWLIAPGGARKEWRRQCSKWLNRPLLVEGGSGLFEYVTSFESLHKVMDEASNPPDGVIFDESIKIKNPSAQRSKIAYELTRLMRSSKEKSYIIEFNGLPAPKDPTDWWHQIKCISPGLIPQGTIHRFRDRMAIISEHMGDYGSYKKVDSWREDEITLLGKQIAPVVHRVEKKDVLPDLPDKIYDVIKCEPTAEDLTTAAIIVKQAITGLQALEALRQVSDGFRYEGPERITTWIGSPKIQVIKDLLDFYHKENGGPGRLVIYAPYVASLKKLVDVVKETQGTDVPWQYISVIGGKWSDDLALEWWSTSDLNICIVANPASMHGVSLKETHALVYYSNAFNPDARGQSEERRDRLDMDMSIATRIVDIDYLPVDAYVRKHLKDGFDLQKITIDEIKKWLSIPNKDKD